MAEESTASAPLLDDRVRGLVGKELVRRTGVVETEAFQRWATAVGDRNPLYFDPEFAREHGYRDVVMPPLFLQDISHPIRPLEDLTPDGLPESGEVYSLLDLPSCPRKMAAGVDVTFHEPIYGGDEVTSSTVVESAEEKHGRSGDFVLFVWKTTHTRGDGTLLAEETRLLVARP